MLALLVELGAALRQLLLGLALFAQSGPFLPFGLLLGLLGVLVAERQIELLQAQGVVPAVDPEVDESSQALNLVAGAFQSFAGGVAVTGLDGQDAVLRLGVVGPQHHLGHVGDEFAALGR